MASIPPWLARPARRTAAAPAPAFVPDPDLLALMDQVVEVRVDSNADGSARSAHGGAARGPYVAVSGLGAVPCHGPCSRTQTVIAPDGRPVADRFDRWVFASPVALDGTHVLAWRDPDRGGAERLFFVRGPSDAPGRDLADDGRPLYWRCDTDERGAGGLP